MLDYEITCHGYRVTIRIIIFLQERSLAIQPSHAALDVLLNRFAISNNYCNNFLISPHKTVVTICEYLGMPFLDILQEFIKIFRLGLEAYNRYLFWHFSTPL